MRVPLFDLKANYVIARNEGLAVVAEVFESQACIGGLKTSGLETAIAELFDCKYAVGVSSGTLCASLQPHEPRYW